MHVSGVVWAVQLVFVELCVLFGQAMLTPDRGRKDKCSYLRGPGRKGLTQGGGCQLQPGPSSHTVTGNSGTFTEMVDTLHP